MAEDRTEDLSRVTGADALYVLSQFNNLCPGAHVTVKVRNTRDKSLFVHHAPVEGLEKEWNEWLFRALASYSRGGSNILYNISPVLRPRYRTKPVLMTLAAYFSLKNVTMADRLRQMAVLHKAQFEPSYVVQWNSGLCGVYVLDKQLTEDRHRRLSRTIAHLIDSQNVRAGDKPNLELPLPGFVFDGKPVRLLHPAKPTTVSVRLFSAGEFSGFPEVTLENVERFYKEAEDLGDQKALEFVASLIQEAREKGDNRPALLGMLVHRRAARSRIRGTIEFREPDRTVVSDFRAVPVKYWNEFYAYVRFGAGMNHDRLAHLVMRILNSSLGVNISDELACQGLDRYLIREMILAGFNRAAVIEFFTRPGNNVGEGKNAAYLGQLYDYEISLLRTADKEARAEEEKRRGEVNPRGFEFISAVCSEIDKAGDLKKLKGTARVEGDVLSLNPAKAHKRLYLPVVLARKQTPLSLQQVRYIFRKCTDHYWLGSLGVRKRYWWCFSVQRLRDHGLLKIFTTLTDRKSELKAKAPKGDDNLTK